MADDLENLDDLTLGGGSGGGRGGRRNKPKVLVYLIGGIFVLFVLIFAYFKFSGKSVQEQAANVRQTDIARSGDRINNSATDTDSEVYRQAFKDEDIERADRNEAAGKSAIPRLMQDSKTPSPPIKEPEPAEPEPEPEPEPAPPPPPYARPAPAPQYQPQVGKAALEPFLGSGEYSPGAVQISNIERKAPREEREGAAQGAGASGSAGDAQNATPAAEAGLENIKITPGTLLYAVVDVGANSDDGSTPVMATVVSGRYNGAKLIGGFQRREERLVVQFNRMVITNKKGEGKVYGISGYAINPDDYSSGVASSVNNHYLERWGGLIASSFLEGFGEAKSRSGTTYMYGNDNNPGQMMTNYDLADEAWIAAGKVGEELADKFEDKFDMPPTVKLDPGTPIGVLVL